MKITEQTLECMKTYGGAFVQSLATCYRLADEANRVKLEVTFHGYFDLYASMAAMVDGMNKTQTQNNENI